jgi:hypothetical protein
MSWDKPATTVDRAGTSRRRRVAALVTFDLAMLIELAIAMYRANAHAADFTGVFLRTFFGLLLPTLLLWWYARRKILSQQREQNSDADSVVGGERS